MYQVRVERDSISPEGYRLTSFVITFPRMVLAEVVTHRVNKDTWGGEYSWCERTTDESISKNSASSRAIPFERMLDKVMNDPYMPKWTLNQKGMQGVDTNDPEIIESANDCWLRTRDYCIEAAKMLVALGIHKQDANRLLENWVWVTQIVTSSRWDNFFALRCHNAAHPAFRHVARMMFLARRKSIPNHLMHGEWHLPFVDMPTQNEFSWKPSFDDLDNGLDAESMPDPIKFSAARCGWVSYENHDRDGTPEAMKRTFSRFSAEPPIHASPVEHQATPHITFSSRHCGSNLTGWLQARKLIKMEQVKVYDPPQSEIDGWQIDESLL